MQEYWHSLTSRERLLISVAGGLAFLVLIYFLVARPMQARHEDSLRALSAAQGTYDTVLKRAAQLKSADAAADARGQANGETVTLRVAVSRAARETGVTISRLQPSEDGALTIWVEGVQSATLYRWLNVLADQQGVGPANVLVQKTSSGEGLRAQVRFLGDGG